MSDRLPEPTPARCACGPTWVFLGYRMLPCGKCGERVTFDVHGARQKIGGANERG